MTKLLELVLCIKVYESIQSVLVSDGSPPLLSTANTSPRQVSGMERERKVSMRLHRGAPVNVSSSDLTGRQDASRMSTSQVRVSPRSTPLPGAFARPPGPRLRNTQPHTNDHPPWLCQCSASAQLLLQHANVPCHVFGFFPLSVGPKGLSQASAGLMQSLTA